MVADNSKFPAPAYRDTVLAPLFDGTKTHFWDELMRLHRAHGVMLAEQGICSAAEIGRILEDIFLSTKPNRSRFPGRCDQRVRINPIGRIAVRHLSFDVRKIGANRFQ